MAVLILVVKAKVGQPRLIPFHYSIPRPDGI